MILNAVADPATGVFSVADDAPEVGQRRAIFGESVVETILRSMATAERLPPGLLAEPRPIHTLTRQQRRQAARTAEKAARIAR